jgi:hypothetical protein
MMSLLWARQLAFECKPGSYRGLAAGLAQKKFAAALKLKALSEARATLEELQQ